MYLSIQSTWPLQNRLRASEPKPQTSGRTAIQLSAGGGLLEVYHCPAFAILQTQLPDNGRCITSTAAPRKTVGVKKPPSITVRQFYRSPLRTSSADSITCASCGTAVDRRRQRFIGRRFHRDVDAKSAPNHAASGRLPKPSLSQPNARNPLRYAYTVCSGIFPRHRRTDGYLLLFWLNVSLFFLRLLA